MKFFKILLKVVGGGILLIVITFVILVRFTDLTISHSRKAILGYNEETGNWVINDWEERHLKGIDGPYVFRENGLLRSIRVVEQNQTLVVKKDSVKLDSVNRFPVVVDNPEKDQFWVTLQRQYIPQQSIYPQPPKLVAVSDIEGNFEAFQSLLQAQGVMDQNFNWTFADGHLVLVGDFMDRGSNVTQVLWLIYQLEQEAAQAGGKVHFVLGNHEALNLQQRINYVNKKYIAIAQKIADEKNYKVAYAQLMNKNNELVKWLKTKNLMVKIGDNLFVHGGISPELVTSGLSIQQINEIGRNTIAERLYNATEGDPNANLIAGRLGPLWFRGLVTDYKEYYKKSTEAQVHRALDAFAAKRMVIGHTVVEQVSADYQGKVIRIDVNHKKAVQEGTCRGILIENDQLYKVDDQGNREMITDD